MKRMKYDRGGSRRFADLNERILFNDPIYRYRSPVDKCKSYV